MAHPTRRRFLQAGAGLTVSRGIRAAQSSPPAFALDSFPYGAVELFDGPFKRQFDQNHSFFLHLSEDRLLKIYRQRAGLPAPGEDMGGWYDDFCPGAHFGQYVSALARFSAATHSQETAAKVQRLVRGYAQTIETTDRFFVNLRYPAYTFDKLVCGLIDAKAWAGDDAAIATLYATTKAARPHMAERALTPEERQQRPHKDETYTWDETYTLAENLCLAYELTRDRMFSTMARPYLQDRAFFDPLARGEDVLAGLHAYSHVNSLSSGMQAYLQLGDPKYLRAVTHAVELIWRDQSYATGGWGPNEAFVEPGKGLLGASLSTTHRHFETPCGAYAHSKLMRYLLRLTRDTRYGDSMERVLYNTVLGAFPILEDGSSFYYSDYHSAGFKTYRRDIENAKYRWDHDGRWPCCSGTLPQVSADYVINAYFRGADGVYVNLYLPSKLTWLAEKSRCTLRQETDYPLGNLVTISVDCSPPREFSMCLRIPAWAGPNTSVSINGKRAEGNIRPGAFFEVRRTWKPGDRVELEFDQRIRTEPVDRETSDQVAILRGPLVLFGMQDEQPKLPKPALSRLAYDGTFVSFGDTQIPVRPFYSIGGQTYHTYWQVTDAAPT